MDNVKIVEALKSVKETDWVGNIKHASLELAFRAINNRSTNSGHYTMPVVRIPGLKGFYGINESKTIFFESRVMLIDDFYVIENLSNKGYSDFENKYTDPNFKVNN